MGKLSVQQYQHIIQNVSSQKGLQMTQQGTNLYNSSEIKRNIKLWDKWHSTEPALWSTEFCALKTPQNLTVLALWYENKYHST